MGDLGGGVQVQFTVVGDTVNVASRLEALTREYHALAIVSEEAMASALARDPDARRGFVRVESLSLRGRTMPLQAWMLPHRTAESGA
jgi:adenylate cyclase